MVFPRGFLFFPYLSLFLGIPMLVRCRPHASVPFLRSRLRTDAIQSLPLKGRGHVCMPTPGIPGDINCASSFPLQYRAEPCLRYSRRNESAAADRFQDGRRTAGSTRGGRRGSVFQVLETHSPPQTSFSYDHQNPRGLTTAHVGSSFVKQLAADRRGTDSYGSDMFAFCGEYTYFFCKQAAVFQVSALQHAVASSPRSSRRNRLFGPLEAMLRMLKRSRPILQSSRTNGIPDIEPDDTPVHASFLKPHSSSPLAPLLSLHEQQKASHKAGGAVELSLQDAQAATAPEHSSPILSAPFPPTSAERFPIGQNLLVDSETPIRRTDAYPGSGQRKRVEQVDNGIPPEARFLGPLSFCDDRELPGPEMNLAAPEDVYILDFENVIHTNTRELLQTTVRAWRRIESGSTEHLHSAFKQHTCRKLESENMSIRSEGEVQQACSLDGTAPTTSSVSLPPLFLSARFGGEAPFWLRERARDLRRSLALRSVADFMVALRRVLEVVVETEAKRGETVDEFVEGRQRAFDAQWRTMDDVERMWLLTREGDMGAVRDVFAFKRAGGVFPWVVRSLRGWEKQGGARRAELYRQYGVTPEQLQEEFDSARREWQRNDLQGWEEHVKYRSDTGHLTPNDERREAYEGFNPAAICLINNHINSWQRPVHIISSWERSEDLLRMLQLMGLNFDHANAKKLLFLYGRDKMEAVPAAQNSEQTGVDDGAIREKVALVNSILDRWKPRSDFWRPAHVVDGNVHSLLALSRDSGIARARLYFCEWGHSAIGDKVKAFLAGRIKYLKESSQLVKLMGTPADIPARQWTHGFTSCPPEWLEAYKMMPWLRWTGLTEKEETILQDFTMPPPTESPITSSITY
uniref:Transmembrane protein n=1 Tax=Neospora caninum (strain Liverpool) TaxID=572307 RepID=A0A0F7UD75_NEOCL|nr:TPA: hypothetical protein BN1204_027950 [Neospora caninum Liverpool]